MPNATVTVREIKNEATGVDLSIPSHKEEKGLFGPTVEYQVVVVSRLQCFKSPKHADSDNVQFMISKEGDDFDDYRRKLSLHFSGTIFPQLPKKGLSTMLGDSQANARRVTYEKFIQFIASTPKLAHCIETLEFLGVDPITASNFRINAPPKTDSEDIFEENRKTTPSKRKTKAAQAANIFGDLDDEEEDLFGSHTTKTAKDEDDALFSDSKPQDESKVQAKLFGDQDLSADPALEEDMMIGVSKDDDNVQLTPAPTEDTSELLTIEDDLEDLLKINKEKPMQSTTEEAKEDVEPKSPSKPGPPTAAKPALSPKKSNPPATLPKPAPTAKPSPPVKSPKPGDKPAVAPKPKPKPKPKPAEAEKPKEPGLFDEHAGDDQTDALFNSPAAESKTSNTTSSKATKVPLFEDDLFPEKDIFGSDNSEDLFTKKSKAAASADDDDLFNMPTEASTNASNLDTEDILSYIKDNTSKSGSDDLFS